MKKSKENMNLSGHRTFIRFIHQFLVNTYSTQKLGGFEAAKNYEKCREKWWSGSELGSRLFLFCCWSSSWLKKAIKNFWSSHKRCFSRFRKGCRTIESKYFTQLMGILIKRKNIKRKNEIKSICKENNKNYAIYCDACHSLVR